MVLLSDKQAALDFPKGDIELALCEDCGFIWNVAFDPGFMEYSPNYESSQAYSPRFNAYAEHLAINLIDKYDLNGKDIVEIGCGRGDFLELICKLGNNHGVGIDPAAGDGASDGASNGHIRLVRDSYSEKYGDYVSDLLLCRHTLEHISDVGAFVATIRRALGNSKTLVFFELPDVTRVLRETAFWDIYYEHCSYFSADSLANFFASNGFDDIEVTTAFDDQYLLLNARPSIGRPHSSPVQSAFVETLRHDVDDFTGNYASKLQYWRDWLAQAASRGKRSIVWGGGSKGVAFLNTLGIGEEVDYMVDINPLKQNLYAAGAGHKIMGPDYLRDHKPDVILIMNPIYYEEIRELVQNMDVDAEYVTV